ncbi:MAG: uroporphyrinogen decarboxylase family protein [Candidatus Zipacnadales bacterium]
MTPKERVLTTLRHEEPDRVPLGEFAIDYVVVEKILGRKSYLRGKRQLIEAYWDGRRDEAVESIKRDTVDLTLELGLDMVRVDLVPDRDRIFPRPRQIDENTWADEWGGVYRFSDLTQDIMILKAPEKVPAYEDPARIEQGLRIPTPSELEVVDFVLEKLGDTHFIWTGTGTGPVGLPYHSALWVEPWLLAIVEQPEAVKEARVKAAERLRKAAHYWKAKGLDGLCLAEDLGYNSGPFMSPQQFRELFLPGYQAQAKASHDEGMPLLFHSCGNLTQIWEPLAETGFDAYQAIQPEENLSDLKHLHGAQIALWGGVSCHNLVVKGTDEIREEVRQACEVCMPGGGFILGSSHSIGVAVKPENLRTMCEAGHDFGRY